MSTLSPSGGLHSTQLARRGWKGIFDGLKVPGFRKYWLSLFVLNFGGQMLMPAQAWLAYELTGSPLKLTLVAAMQSIPWFLLSLYSGVISDRIQKRDVIIACQVISTFVAAIIAVLIATGEIQYWHLLVSSFIAGINGAFNQTARNSIMAELVPRDRLYNAIALNNVGTCTASIIGPAISGILIGVVSTEGAYYAGIGLYIIGIIMMRLVPVTGNLARVQPGSMFKHLVEGLRYVRGQRVLMIIFVLELALTLFGVTYSGLMPVFASLWNLESEGYGFLLAASGVGSLLASLAVASLGNYKRKGALILVSGIVFGLMLLLFSNTGYLDNWLGLGSGLFFFACFSSIAVGFMATAFSTTSNTSIQMGSSDEFRGRVNGVYSMIVALHPLATLGLGAMAEGIGAPLALSISAGILTLVMASVLIFVRPIRQME